MTWWMRVLAAVSILVAVWVMTMAPLPSGPARVVGALIVHAGVTPWRRRRHEWAAAVVAAGHIPFEGQPAIGPGFRKGLLVFLGFVALLFVRAAIFG